MMMVSIGIPALLAALIAINLPMRTAAQYDPSANLTGVDLYSYVAEAGLFVRLMYATG